MSILNEEDNLITNNEKTNAGFHIPAVYYDDKDEISFKKSILIALLLHPVAAASIWFLSFLLIL